MALSLEDLKNAFKSNDSERTNNSGGNFYPFWNMKDGEQAMVRFLPDKNPDNPMGFLVEKLTHTLTINGETKSVPCLKMYGEDCPICKVSASFYKEGDKVNGKKYWRKKQHIAQALIVEDPLPPDSETGENHEGKVRFLSLGYQLFNIIKDAFESGELDEVPFAYQGGCNFIIKKTRQGEYSTYAVGSKFSRKVTDLTDDEIAMVEEHLVDLSTLLPPHPGLEKVEAMLEASLTGNPVDVESSESGIESFVSSKKQTDDNEPTTSTPVEASTDDLEDEADKILAQIRARRQSAS